MRYWVPVVFAALVMPVAGLAQQGSKAEARALLTQVSQRFQESLKDVNERQWDYKAPTQKHTIGALAEHAALSANELQTIVQRAIDRGPQPALAETLSGQVDVIKEIMLDKENPPENFRPAGRLVTKADIEEYFPQVRTKALKLLDSSAYAELSVYEHSYDKIGNLTAVQWFYYIAYLVQAHTEQIERIKLDPGYPKS